MAERGREEADPDEKAKPAAPAVAAAAKAGRVARRQSGSAMVTRIGGWFPIAANWGGAVA